LYGNLMASGLKSKLMSQRRRYVATKSLKENFGICWIVSHWQCLSISVVVWCRLARGKSIVKDQRCTQGLLFIQLLIVFAIFYPRLMPFRFRDLLHSRYRSSTKSKVQLRRERRRRQRATACSDGDDNDDDAVNEQISGSAGSEHSQAQGHKRTGSCDNLEPLPLISQRSVESIMYNCPFELVTSQQQSDAFLEGGQEGGNRASENDSFQLHEKKPSPQSEVEDHENNAASAFITPGSLISSLPAITQTNNGNTPDGSASVTHQASSKNFAGAKPLQCIEERGYTQHHYFQPTPPHLLPGFYSGSYPPLPPPSYHGYPGSYCYYPPPTYDPSPYRPGWPPQHVFYAPSPPRRYYSPPSHYSPSAVYLESLAWMRDEEKNSSERFKEDNYDQGSRPCSQGSYFDDLEAQEKENK